MINPTNYFIFTGRVKNEANRFSLKDGTPFISLLVTSSCKTVTIKLNFKGKEAERAMSLLGLNSTISVIGHFDAIKVKDQWEIVNQVDSFLPIKTDETIKPFSITKPIPKTTKMAERQFAASNPDAWKE